MDMPWDKLLVRVVQIETLSEVLYPAQRGVARQLVKTLAQHRYRLAANVSVGPAGDTFDLIFEFSGDAEREARCRATENAGAQKKLASLGA